MEGKNRAKHDSSGREQKRCQNKGNGRQKTNFKEEKLCENVVTLKANGLNFPI